MVTLEKIAEAFCKDFDSMSKLNFMEQMLVTQQYAMMHNALIRTHSKSVSRQDLVQFLAQTVSVTWCENNDIWGYWLHPDGSLYSNTHETGQGCWGDPMSFLERYPDAPRISDLIFILKTNNHLANNYWSNELFEL